MSDIKKIGLWIDYTKADFIDVNSENKILKTINSGYDKTPREEGRGADGTRWGANSSSNEHRKENKLQGQLDKYYREVEKELSDYNEILVFGPGMAKNELKNILNENKLFNDKKLHIESSDSLTSKQLLAYVRNYFS